MKLRGPDGQVVDVDEREAARLIQTVGGWRPDGGGDVPVMDTVRAGAEGVLRGFTLGMSDEFLAGAAGAPYREADGTLVTQAVDESGDIKKRREESPVASTLGELGGTLLGPAKLFGPSATLRGAVASGMAEGGLYGLSKAITEDAFGDKEALGEKLLANVGLGAFLGGPAGALGFGLTRGANALASKTSNASLKVDLDALKVLAKDARGGAYKDAATKAGFRWDAVDDFAKAEGIFTARATPESVQSTATAAAQRARAEALKALDDFAGPDGYFDTQEMAQSVGEAGKKLFRSFDPVEQRVGRGVINRAADVVEGGQRGFSSWGRWLDVVTNTFKSGSAADRKYADEFLKGGLKMIARQDQEAAKAIADAVMKVRMGEFLGARARGATGSSIGEAAVAGALGGLYGGPGGALSGAVGAAASAELRRRAPFLTSAALEALGPGLQRAADGLQRHVTKFLTTVPEYLGPFRSVLEKAMAEGAPELLRAHVELASSAAGGEYLARLGLEAESPEDADLATSRAAMLDTLEAQARSSDDKLEAWAKRMVGSMPGPSPSEKPMTAKDFEERVEGLRTVLKRPETYFESMPPEMMSDAPGTTIALASQVSKAAQYLLDKAPKNPWEHLPENLRPKWAPGPGEMADFEAAAFGIEQPLAALERAAQGRVRPQTLEAIAAVYPKLYDEARQRLFEKVATAKNLSYERRLALQPFLGPMATGSTVEQGVVLMQMYDKQRQPAAPRGGPDGRQVVSTTQNLQTQATRMEARGATS